MDVNAVITQLRQNCPVFEGRIGGAAEYQNGLMLSANLTMPAAYVIPDGDSASGNDMLNGVWQTVTERVSVFVMVSNVERRGQTSVTSINDIRTQVWACLLNWRNMSDPQFAPRGLEYAGAGLTAMDGDRLIYEFKFTRTIQISVDDGWQIPGDPLVEVDLNDTNAPLTATVTGFQS